MHKKFLLLVFTIFTTISFDYELYDEASSDGRYYFNILTINFIDKFYMIDSNGIEYGYASNLEDNGIRTLGSVLEHSRIKFDIYASAQTNCYETLILSKTVEVPYFNQYSLRDECVGKEEIPICQRYYGGVIKNEEDFLNQMKTYQQEESQKEEKNFLDYIVDFVKDNLVISILVLVVIGVSVIIVVVRYLINRKKIRIKI